jgi:hypothetical protein
MEEDYDLGTGMTIISIVMDETGPPRIELDGCHPVIAANIFRQAAELLEDIMVKPTILNGDEIVTADETFFMFMDDDDE